jgi:hypothetical protein
MVADAADASPLIQRTKGNTTRFARAHCAPIRGDCVRCVRLADLEPNWDAIDQIIVTLNRPSVGLTKSPRKGEGRCK